MNILRVLIAFLLVAPLAEAGNRDAASANFGDVQCAVNGPGSVGASNPCVDAHGDAINGAAGDGDKVFLPQTPAGGVTWTANQTVTINNAVSIIGQPPNPYPIVLPPSAGGQPGATGSTWPTRINMTGDVFKFNTHQSPFTIELANINFFIGAGVTIGGSIPFNFDGVARCWLDISGRTAVPPTPDVPRGGVRIHHIQWTTNGPQSEAACKKWRMAGWITGVMDHCFIDVPVNGANYQPTENTLNNYDLSPTGLKSPIQTTEGYWGHWGLFGRAVPGATIPTGNAAGPTAEDPRFPSDHFPDLAGDTFYWEDNVFNRPGIILDTNGGAGNRHLYRHNTSTGTNTGHGNDTSEWVSSNFDEYYNNKVEQADTGLGGSWKASQNRGGARIEYNELWTGFQYPDNFNCSAYRLFGNKCGFGPSDGTNFNDQNWNEHLFGRLIRTPPRTSTPVTYNPVAGPSDVATENVVVGGFTVNFVPKDIRIGSVYARSLPAPAPTPFNQVQASSNSWKIIGLKSTVTNQWSGFQIRNVTTSRLASVGAQPDIKINNLDNNWSLIHTSIPDANGDTTIVTNNATTGPMKLGVNDPWELRFVRKYARNQGAGPMKLPWNGKQVGGGNPTIGVTLLAVNGSAYAPNPSPGPSPVNTPGSNPCTVANINNCNPRYADDETQEYGTWLWSIAQRERWVKNAAGVNYSEATSLQSQNIYNAGQAGAGNLAFYSYPFWTGGLHIRDKVQNNGGDTNGAPTFGRDGVTTGGANSAAILPLVIQPAVLAKCPPLYSVVASPPSAYRRIGADWDGDPNPPMVGITTAYKGNTRQPDGAGATPPTGSNLDISSWKVYGASGAIAGVAAGPQTYPHPLVSALADPAFTSESSKDIVVGVASTTTPGQPNSEIRITAAGNPLPTVTRVSGAATGVTFTPGPTLDGFGILSWTSGTVVGDYLWKFQADNGSPSSKTQDFTLHVKASAGTPPAIVGGPNASGSLTVGITGPPITITATGDAPLHLSIPPDSLPQGVSFTDNGGGSATLTGTPVSSAVSPWVFDIRAHSDTTPPDYIQHFTLAINPVGGTAPRITSAATAIFSVAQLGTFTVTTTGSPAPSLSFTGALPSGVSFTDNGNGTATITGIPAAGTPANSPWPIQITAHNATPPDFVQSFSLTVNPVPVVNPTPPTVIFITP